MKPPFETPRATCHHRWSTSLVVALLVLFVVTACEREDPEIEAPPTPDHSPTVIKSANWPDEPQRLVSMAPNITEILFELGLGDRVVAVTRYCDWPSEVDKLPRIGGMLDPDYEAILAAEPDLVLGVTDGADHQIADKLDTAGVAYGFIEIDALDTVIAGIQTLGRWLDAEEPAAQAVDEMQRAITSTSAQISATLQTEQPSALIVYDRQPVVAAGPGSFGDELLELAGLQNAIGADQNLGSYPVLDMEKILAADPQIIIDVTIGPKASGQSLTFWRQFDSLNAVRGERVVHIDDPVMMRPGPRIPIALQRLAEAIEGL